MWPRPAATGDLGRKVLYFLYSSFPSSHLNPHRGQRELCQCVLRTDSAWHVPVSWISPWASEFVLLCSSSSLTTCPSSDHFHALLSLHFVSTLLHPSLILHYILGLGLDFFFFFLVEGGGRQGKDNPLVLSGLFVWFVCFFGGFTSILCSKFCLVHVSVKWISILPFGFPHSCPHPCPFSYTFSLGSSSFSHGCVSIWCMHVLRPHLFSLPSAPFMDVGCVGAISSLWALLFLFWLLCLIFLSFCYSCVFGLGHFFSWWW